MTTGTNLLSGLSGACNPEEPPIIRIWFAKMKCARKDAKLNILHKLNNLVALAETLVFVAIIHS
ncbi:hypothetical protein AHAS_Ahas10G0107800 [Arachis hypogaea]